MARSTSAAIFLSAGEGRPLWHLGALMTFKTLMFETRDQFWAVEGFADPAMAVPLHAHEHEDEIWYVVDGEIEFTIDGDTHRGGPGTFADIPRTVPHTFRVLSETARWFGFGLSGRLDGWFFETGVPAERPTLPPPPPGPPDGAAIAAIVASLERYGTKTLGPPATV